MAPDQPDETNAPVAAAEADRPGDDHPGIPRDANGIPIWLRLPADMRAKYDRKLERCRARWRATRDPAFIIEALILTSPASAAAGAMARGSHLRCSRSGQDQRSQ